MPDLTPWQCPHCRTEQTDEVICRACDTMRYASFAIQVAAHITEHLADGLASPFDVLLAMQARPCYARRDFTLAFIAQQMRLLTTDTTQLARQIAKARASRMMLEVCETGSNAEKLAVLKGTQVLGDVVEHKGEVTSRFVVETHEGAPPARTD